RPRGVCDGQRGLFGVRASPVSGACDGRRGRAAAGRTRGDRGDRAPPLRSLLDLAAAQAARADEQPPHPAVYLRAHHLEVRLPGALGTVVGVAHVVAHGAVLSTNFTASRHRRPFSETTTL